MNWYEQSKRRVTASTDEPMSKEANGIVMIRKRTTMGKLMETYINTLATLIRKENPSLQKMTLDVRGQDDLGFRFTKYDLNGEKLLYFADISFELANLHIKITIRGANGSKTFSDTLRMFLTDDAVKLSRRIAGRMGI